MDRTTSIPKRPFYMRYKGTILFVVVGIITTALFINTASGFALFWFFMYFVGLPMCYQSILYVWKRLCRDPFLHPSAKLGSTSLNAFTTCPPNPRTTLPTLIFYFVFSMFFIGGAFMARPLGHNQKEPNPFMVFNYNGFGSLVSLICAIWLVDTLHVFHLFYLAFSDKNNKQLHSYFFLPQYREVVVVANDDSSSGSGDDNKQRRRIADNQTSAQKRLFLIIVLYVWWFAWSWVSGYNPIIIKHDIPIKNLPPQCDGFQLAVVADLHAGALAGVKETISTVKLVNDLSPDAVALVGDIGDQPVTDILHEKLAPLVTLEAPDGVYWSPGEMRVEESFFKRVF